MKNYKPYSLFAAALIGLVVSANALAETYTYTFGTKMDASEAGPANLGGDYPGAALNHSDPVTLIFDTSNHQFTFSQFFDWKGVQVKAIAVNYMGSPMPAATFTDSTTTDRRDGASDDLIDAITSSSFGGPFDANTNAFIWNLGGDGMNMSRGDSVTWTVPGFDPSLLPDEEPHFAILVFRSTPEDHDLSEDTVCQAAGLYTCYPDMENGTWFRPSSVTVANPVPEPETYAMLLAGLGVLGFSARRRAGK